MSHKVLVVGSGGIGSLYGALLHKAGWQVDMEVGRASCRERG